MKQTPAIADHDRIYFRHLDVVRFVAAFMVVIYHTHESWNGWFGSIGQTPETAFSLTRFFTKNVIGNLGIGVDIFFLISGFLITYLLLMEKKKHGRIAIGKFIIRRSLRIWPLYFLLIAVSPFLVSWLDTSPDPDYTANIFFLGNFDIIDSKSWTYPLSHFWSICVEEHFYLVWPFIIAFVPVNRLRAVFFGIILFSILFRFWAFLYVEQPWYTLFLHTFSRMDVLVIGAIGAYYYAEKPFQFVLPVYLRWILVAGFFFALSLESVVAWDTIFMACFKKYFYIGILAVLLLDYNFNHKAKRFLPDNSILHYFGKVSYGIYMFSNILLIIVVKKIMWTFQIYNIWVFFAITFALAIIIPVLSYELFEKHALKLAKKFRVLKIGRQP